MRVTSLGHAALYIETGDQRLLIDPVFADTLAGGALAYHPARRVDLARLPDVTALVVTHGHFDHFHAPSLHELDRNLPVFAPHDAELLAALAELGFRRVTPCAPWQTFELGRTRLMPTPSGHEEPEFGLVVSEAGSTFWHMADSEVTPRDGERLLEMYGRLDVVSVKYQPVVRASMGYLRSRGARFDKAEVVAWLETACAVAPAFVFPYASGLCFAGRHTWFNRVALPYSAEEVASLLARRLGPERAATLEPGDAVEVEAGGKPRKLSQACAFVSALPSPALVWEPVDVSTLAGLESADERAELERLLDGFLASKVGPWLQRELAGSESPWRLRRTPVIVWQLVVELGDGVRLERHLDYGQDEVVFVRGRHPEANSFTHVSARALYDVLRGEAPGFLFWLAGDARSYEKAIGVVDGRLLAGPEFPPEDEPGDPLTTFLRRFGPNSEGAATPVLQLPPTARGDSPAQARKVLEKRALLLLLSAREAERLGGLVSEAEVQAMSDEFRGKFGLVDPERTGEWLTRVGLSLEDYTRVMRGFTTLRAVQDRCATEVSGLADAYGKVLSIQADAPGVKGE